MPTFVLIPGAGTDPRVFGPTIDVLRELGHDGIAPPLPLDDERATPSDHADAVASAVAEASDLVVVAQSLGAFAGPLVAARVPVTQLILLAPMIPAPGETAGDWWRDTGHDKAIAGAVERHGPMREWGQEALEDVFLHDVDPQVAQESARFSGPAGEGMFGEPWPLDAWPDVPTRVLIPRDDRLFPIGFQRRVARERLGVEIDEMAGGHVPMLSRPRELAERLAELAGDGKATVTLPADDQILITRRLGAPPGAVYEAWTTPDLVKRWWSGERGEMKVVEIDLRVGGTWRYVLATPDGSEVAFHGTYREVVPGERIVTTEIYEQPGAPEMPDSEAPVTVTEFAGGDDGTTLTLLVQCPSAELRDTILESGMEPGVQEQLARLERVASGLAE